jgi:hypothetical protein
LGFGSLILEMVHSASRHASGVSREDAKKSSKEGVGVKIGIEDELLS